MVDCGDCFSDLIRDLVDVRDGIGNRLVRHGGGWRGCSAGVPIPYVSRGSDVTLNYDGLYDLDISIPDVIGLRAWQLEAAVVTVMSIQYNRCVRVVIPDQNVGHEGFHEVLIHDMAEADSPYVAMGDLANLQAWAAIS